MFDILKRKHLYAFCEFKVNNVHYGTLRDIEKTPEGFLIFKFHDNYELQINPMQGWTKHFSRFQVTHYTEERGSIQIWAKDHAKKGEVYSFNISPYLFVRIPEKMLDLHLITKNGEKSLARIPAAGFFEWFIKHHGTYTNVTVTDQDQMVFGYSHDIITFPLELRNLLIHTFMEAKK